MFVAMALFYIVMDTLFIILYEYNYIDLNRKWGLVKLNGKKISDPNKFTIEFSVNKFSGKEDCNTFNGTYKKCSSNYIKIDNYIVMTKAYCGKLDFVDNLLKVNYVELINEENKRKLILSKDDIKLEFDEIVNK